MASSMSGDLMVLIENAVNGRQNTAIKDIVKGIQQKQYTLLDVVEALGPYLTSNEVQRRVEGIRLLAGIIKLLPSDWFNEKEVVVLVSFMCDRLNDHHSVIPHVTEAAAGLLRTNVISKEDIHKMLSAIFNEVHVQSLTQAERRHVYYVIEYLLVNRLQDLQSMGTDFVFGYIQCMDGEKDPRNLVIAFNCVNLIARNITLGPFVEDLFDVVACYFPIDFNPPADDPHGITKEQLVEGLRQCLSSTALFAEFCLPLLIEKLTSVIQSAKIDAFLTLAACSCVYGEKLTEYSGTLWSCIRKEVYAPMTRDVEEAALTALTAMTTALSKLVIPPDGSSLLDAFIQDIIQDVCRHLCEPEQKLVIPSSRLLQAVAAASNPACCIVFREVIALLLDQFEQHKQVSDRKVLIQQVVDFLRLISGWTDYGSNPALEYKERLYTTFISLISHNTPTMCQLGIQGMLALRHIPSMLSEDELGICSQHLLLATFQDDKDVRKSAVSALATLCPQLKSDSIKSIFAELKKRGETDNDLCLEVMSQIARCLDVIKEVVPYYLNCLNQLSHDSGDESLSEALKVSSHLYTVIQNTKCVKECVEFLYDVVIPRVYKLCILGAVNSSCVFKDWTIIETLASCVRVIICHSEERPAEQLLLSTVSLFLDHDVSQLTGLLPQDTDLSGFNPLSVEAPSSQTQLMCLFTAVICSQPTSVGIPRHTEILNKLLNVATRWQHPLSAMAAAKCFAGLVNKLSDDIPEPSVSELAVGLISSPEFQQRAVLVLIWLTKAMLMRNHRDQRKLINALLGLLSDVNLGGQVAEGFRILLEDSVDILTPEMHATVQFMYKQRLFVFTVDALTEGFRRAKQDVRLSYLIAVSYLLKYVPRDAVMSHLPTLMPLMIQCLQHEGEDLWLSTLSTLEHMINESPELLMTYVDDLVTQLLELTQYKANMKVRIASLRCLCSLTSLPLHVLTPHQGHVTKKLVPVLDDHKRLVRRQAVVTREKWILIGAPGTD